MEDYNVNCDLHLGRPKFSVVLKYFDLKMLRYIIFWLRLVLYLGTQLTFVIYLLIDYKSLLMSLLGVYVVVILVLQSIHKSVVSLVDITYIYGNIQYIIIFKSRNIIIPYHVNQRVITFHNILYISFNVFLRDVNKLAILTYLNRLL